MTKKKHELNQFIKHGVEQFSVRLIRAGKKKYELAESTGLNSGTISQILGLKSKNPRKSSLESIEKALQSWGV